MLVTILTVLIVVILVIALLAYGLKYFITGQYNNSYWPSRGVFLLDMDKVIPYWDRITFKVPIYDIDNKMYHAFKYENGIRSFGGLMQLGKPTLVLIDLDLVKQIAVKDFDSFVDRRDLHVSKIEPTFHRMLMNKSGDDWRSLRATLSPTFSTGKIKRIFPTFNECSLRLVDYIKQQAGSTDEIEIVDSCSKFKLDFIASAAFGLESEVFKNGDSKFATYTKSLFDSFRGLKIFKFIVLLAFPKLSQTLGTSLMNKDALAFFRSVVLKAIKLRRETGERRDDFLQLLMDTQAGELEESAEDGVADNYEKDAQPQTKVKKQQLTDEIILSNALLFFWTGYE